MENILNLLINRFDNYYLNEVPFDNMPSRESEEYRTLLMKIANDKVFFQGRISFATDYYVDIFNDEEVAAACSNQALIDALPEEMRKRLNFYLDLKELCLPLYNGTEVDWSAWPWCMNEGSSSLDNEELFNFIEECKYPFLSCAIFYNLSKQIMCGDNDLFSTVGQQEVADLYYYELDLEWKRTKEDETLVNNLSAKVNECANKLWFIENHMHVGKQLGFDWFEQSIYDAFDTYIDNAYRHNQVTFTKELSACVMELWGDSDEFPTKNIEELRLKTLELTKKYKVSSPNPDYTWNIILLDVLGVPSPEFRKDDDEEDNWDE